MPGTGSKNPRRADRWWTWRWDTTRAENVMVPHIRITRWRRGSFLTVYKMETTSQVQWWLYGPFNLAIAFAFPRAEKRDVVIVDPDHSPVVPPKMPEDGKYWN